MISPGKYKIKKRLNAPLPHAADAASFAIIYTDISGALNARNIVVAAFIGACAAKIGTLIETTSLKNILRFTFAYIAFEVGSTWSAAQAI